MFPQTSLKGILSFCGSSPSCTAGSNVAFRSSGWRSLLAVSTELQFSALTSRTQTRARTRRLRLAVSDGGGGGGRKEKLLAADKRALALQTQPPVWARGRIPYPCLGDCQKPRRVTCLVSRSRMSHRQMEMSAHHVVL